MSFTLHVQVNSPGEVSTWLWPVCCAFSELIPDGDIRVFLTPCQYASGQEATQIAAFPGVSQVFTPKETIEYLRAWPIRKPFLGDGAVLFLGGDPLYSRLLSFKLKLPVYAYTNDKATSWWGFKHVFSRYDGDLMAAKVAYSLNKSAPGSSTESCIFFSGSRPQHTRHLLPIFAAAVREILKVSPEFKAIAPVSPFISDQELANISSENDLSGLTLTRDSGISLMQTSRFLVTVPGSNTSEAAYLHMPMLVVIPLNVPEAIIFDGLLGWITKIPLLGKGLIQLLIFFLKFRKRFYALPNINLNQAVVPEVLGVFSVAKLANEILLRYDDLSYLVAMRQRLSGFFSPSTEPACSLCRAIVNRQPKTS